MAPCRLKSVSQKLVSGPLKAAFFIYLLVAAVLAGWQGFALMRHASPLFLMIAGALLTACALWLILQWAGARLSTRFCQALAEVLGPRVDPKAHGEKFRALAENSNDTIMRFDREYRHLYVNPAVERDTGIPRENFLNKTHEEMGFPAHLVTLWHQAIQRAFDTGKPVRVEFQLPNGLWKDWMLVPEFSREGQIAAVMTTARDITEKKCNEELLVQAEKMLSLGGLAAGMAHEINNPLAGMMQNAQVLAQRLGEESAINKKAASQCGTDMESIRDFMEKRDVFRMLAHIRDSGVRASRVVDNMLDFARPGRSFMCPERLDALLDKTVELAANDYDLKKDYDFRQIRIIRDYASDLPLVCCDPSGIQQVVLNLLKNAAQALSGLPSGQSPSITLKTARQDGMARLEVADNGPGMPEEVRQRILDPFFTTRKVGEGTGLGLSISYFIIKERHGGIMQVESAPGMGTRFIVLIPINPA